MLLKTKTISLDETTWMIKQTILGWSVYSYLLIGQNKTLLIDTGITSRDFKKAVQSLTDKPIIVINTHGHGDHTGNNSDFQTVFIGERETETLKLHNDITYMKNLLRRSFGPVLCFLLKREWKEMLAPKNEYPVSFVQDGTVFDLGGRFVEVIETPGHSVGSVCLLEREKNRLYTGDTVCDKGVLLHLDYSCPTQVFYDTLRKLKSYKNSFDTIYPGHHTTPLATEFIDKYEACARGILDGSLKGKKGISAGAPCEMVTWDGITICRSIAEKEVEEIKN